MKLSKLKKFINRKASVNQYSTRAVIKAVNSNGTYNVELLSGETMQNITPQSLGSTFKYQVDMFVTLEFSGGDWQIAGLAALRGGD